MKILVTGGTGNVGSQVIRELVKRNVSVRALVRKTGGIEKDAERRRGHTGKIRSTRSQYVKRSKESTSSTS